MSVEAHHKPVLRLITQAMPLLTQGVVISVIVGCTISRSTRMTVDDLDTISKELAASLAASDAVKQRHAASPLWVVSIDKVQNLTSDVMTESEQWAVVQRIRGSLPIQALWDQKNIRFVIPPQELTKIRKSNKGDSSQAELGSQRQPTHTMTATFRSITRADAHNRSDLYYCEFEIVDLAAGETVWSDRFEYRRSAAGHIWD